MRRAANKLDTRVRGYVEYHLENYERRKKELSEYRAALMPSMTPGYSSACGSGKGKSRPTEKLGVRLAEDPYILEQLRIIDAIERVLSMLSPEDRQLIELVYFRKSHNITGAAMAVYMGKTMAYERVGLILWALARELGLVPQDFRAKNRTVKRARARA